jgi:hypothetical protein
MVTRGLGRALLLLLMGCVDTHGDVLTTQAGGDAATADAGAVPGDLGTPASCPAEGQCPAPSGGGVSVCGYVIDLENSRPVPSSAGLDVGIFDLADVVDGTALTHVEPDRCGWFSAQVNGVVAGYVAVSTGNRMLGGPFGRVVSLLAASPGDTIRSNVFALRSASDEVWSADARVPVRFGLRGAVLAIFVDDGAPPQPPFSGAPVAGVIVTQNDVPQAGAYYFGDETPLGRTRIAPERTVTGPNGSALSPGTVSGVSYGGAKAGCQFMTVTGLLPAVLQVQEIHGNCN